MIFSGGICYLLLLISNHVNTLFIQKEETQYLYVSNVLCIVACVDSTIYTLTV